VHVIVHGGAYELPEPLIFGPEDSGTAEHPVAYVAAEGESPVISGGRCLHGLTEITHNGLRCWIVDLPDVAAGKWNFTRLYVRNEARSRPRLPKSGFYHFTGVAGYGEFGNSWGHGPDRASFAPGEIKAWRNLQDVEVISYQLWFDTHHRIKSLDEDSCTVHFHTTSVGSLRDEKKEFARYFVENVFEALDTPGQWYLDRPAGRLYYLPLPDEELPDTEIFAPRLQSLLTLKWDSERRPVAHLRFENLVFVGQQWELPKNCSGYVQAAFGVPGAIVLEGAEACVFYGCTVAHVNGYGAEVRAGSRGNTFAACSIYDTGAGGIKIGHEEMPAHHPVTTLEVISGEGIPAMTTTVVDCTIHDCGHIFPSGIGIWIGNCGWNRIIHNHIFHCNYTGISLGWMWGYAPTRTICNQIEHNHIHHINYDEALSDNGGIYSLGIQPGTVLRGNLIHDISCYGYGGFGIYLDEGSSEILVEKNAVFNTKETSFFIHYGRDNLAQNNIFALSRKGHLNFGRREDHRSVVFRNNICVPCNGRITSELLRARYTVAANLFWSLDKSPLTFGGKDIAELQSTGQHIGSVVADPLFTDPAGGDYSLRSDSPAHRLGFQLFDWRDAGIRVRAGRPVTFADYAREFPLPRFEQPVLRARIETRGDNGEFARSGRMELRVSLINAGNRVARGLVRLKVGPTGLSGYLDRPEIAFSVEPNATKSETVVVEVPRDTQEFWVETEPSGDAAIPTRKLVFPLNKDIVSKYWSVIGSFPILAQEKLPGTGLEKVYPPEVLRDFSTPISLEDGTSTHWKSLEGDSDFVNVGAGYSKPRGIICYAVTYVYSPESCGCQLAYGIDYWGKVWVNGDLVGNISVNPTAPTKGYFKSEVALNAGWNEILVKIHSGSGGAGFWMTIIGQGAFEFARQPNS
jgi:hypothetical protein